MLADFCSAAILDHWRRYVIAPMARLDCSDLIKRG
jgi:hypothetical protein